MRKYTAALNFSPGESINPDNKSTVLNNTKKKEKYKRSVERERERERERKVKTQKARQIPEPATLRYTCRKERRRERTYQNLFANKIFATGKFLALPPFSTFIDSWPSQGTLNSGIFKRPEGDKANSPVPIVFANRSLVIRIVRQIANSGPVECTGRITQPTKCPGATRLYYRSRKGYTLLFRVYVSLSLSLSLSLAHTHTVQSLLSSFHLSLARSIRDSTVYTTVVVYQLATLLFNRFNMLV